jgi:hypothetical protein
MDVGKFEWLIAWRRLYMPNVAQFPDHLEGTTPEGHARWWHEQIACAASPEARAIMTRNQIFLEQVAAHWREHYYVSCWHVNEDVNFRMWSEYTSTAEAAAVRTTYRLLRASLPPFVEIGMVRQELRAVALPPITPELGQHEFDSDLFEVEARPGMRVYAPRIEPERLIQTVILHADAPAAFIERMEQLCAANGLPRPSRHTFTRSDTEGQAQSILRSS